MNDNITSLLYTRFLENGIALLYSQCERRPLDLLNMEDQMIRKSQDQDGNGTSRAKHPVCLKLSHSVQPESICFQILDSIMFEHELTPQ